MRRLAFVFSAFTLSAGALPAPAQAPASDRVAPYDWLSAHLPRYRELAARPWPGPLPPVKKKLSPGDAYPGAAALAAILRDLGDLPEGAAVPADGTYGGALVDAVKAFQDRHGLKPDGVVGAGTFSALDVPYAKRLEEIEASLTWLGTIRVPQTESLVVVNIPSFRLYAWTSSRTPSPSTCTTRPRSRSSKGTAAISRTGACASRIRRLSPRFS
ncbi:MAG TPA: peptidoglycan-binding protein [Thermoanaerobaculia bacterium]|nr:peptidoglycan-binding protein [Thermoanaerobaculia bacterium]